ncbi:MEIOTIC F-BOX protein MOF-like [Miscanthus floridulus]|uniref:MEIOTIC F-BOX protein MOF-like n=1 Tax=Miscanthus floridulus TaxID=154761 RepID=UPI00345902BB
MHASRQESQESGGGAPAPDLEPLEDRISALPDGILRHVLGFLPADEAVKTCVLARHWRHQWRSVRRLRIVHSEKGPRRRSADDFVRFVNRLLLLRGPGVALDEFEVSGSVKVLETEIEEEIHIWIRHVLLCNVRVLIINLWTYLRPPLISQHLRRLELNYVDSHADCLDFATCPGLEVLDITHGCLSCLRILSQSVKHLRIISTCFANSIRACISMPGLISLQLNHFEGKAPLLEMPSLHTAFVRPDDLVDDCMKRGDYGGACCGICAYCCGTNDHRGRCVLLGGLSNAMYLELIAYRGTFIFKRDLKGCPTFSKLKTLLLNEWCVAICLSALVCVLEHSPVLEKLILQISQDAECKTEAEGRNHRQMERVPKLSERLKLVEIKCKNVGFRVCEIISFLSRFMQVNLKLVTRNSHLFSFED